MAHGQVINEVSAAIRLSQDQQKEHAVVNPVQVGFKSLMDKLRGKARNEELENNPETNLTIDKGKGFVATNDNINAKLEYLERVRLKEAVLASENKKALEVKHDTKKHRGM